jgi:hypothetical protein
MDGAQDQVAGQAGLHGNGGGFRVPNLADHDDLRVLPHDAAQGDGIGEVLRRADLRLADHREVELHRVLDRADADAGAVPLHDVAERRIHRAGLAGAGGAGEEQQAAGPLHRAQQALEGRILKAEGVQARSACRGGRRAARRSSRRAWWGKWTRAIGRRPIPGHRRQCRPGGGRPGR